MKFKIIKMTSIIVSVIILLACLSSAILLTPYASAATSAQPSDSVRKTDYKTTDSKPTYTATLNENNKLLKDLEEKINGQNGEKDGKLMSFTKKYGKDVLDVTFSLLNLKKQEAEGQDVDWDKFAFDTVKSVIVAITAAYGLGGVADSVLSGIENLTTSGVAALSDVDNLSDDIAQQFSQISDRLYDIEDQISSLSDDVQKAVLDVLGGTGGQIANLDAKQVLRAFMSKGEGNFSYNEYRNYLYGSTRAGNPDHARAYYNQLIEAIANEASLDVIKGYYDKLFDVLYSNVLIFREYYLGEAIGLDKSITKYYYDYISANKSLISDGKTAESMAVEFAYDMYTTYMYSYEVIKLCYSYQISEMFIQEDLSGKELNDYSSYEYSSIDRITYKIIKTDLEGMEGYISDAEEMVVSDLAYIFRLGESYVVTDANGDVHDIARYGNTFGNVAQGQTVYLNKIPDSVNAIFELDVLKYSYSPNGNAISRASELGVINVNSLPNMFTATVKYGDRTLYSIDFVIESTNAFSGGSGSYDDPYLISNEYQFLDIAKELNACYLLISDINFGGLNLTPIGTYKTPFNGILDGNSYTIRNINLYSLAYDDKNVTLTPTTGLFGTIGNNGIVENLNIQNVQVVSDYNNDGISPESDTSYYYVGAIAGYNSGVIYNCSIGGKSSITVNRNKQMQTSRNVHVYVGGIAGKSDNGISYCSVDATSIDAKSTLNLYGEPVGNNHNDLYVGGIVGTTTQTISYCRVGAGVTLAAYAKSTADNKKEVKPYVTAEVGGIVGDDNASSLLTFVHSQATVLHCKGEVYNDGTFLGAHRYTYDNVKIKEGAYYPVFYRPSEGDSIDDFEKKLFEDKFNEYRNKYVRLGGTAAFNADEYARKDTKEYIVEQRNKALAEATTKLGNNIISDYDNEKFLLSAVSYDVTITSNTVYEINIQLLDEDALTFTVNGKQVDAEIVNYYGFDTYNDSNDTITNTVRIFFLTYFDGEERLLYGDVNLTVREDRIIGEPTISGIRTRFNVDSTREEALAQLFAQGFTISYYHANGLVENYYVDTNNKNDVQIFDFNFANSKNGQFTFTVFHNGHIITQTATLICPHSQINQIGYIEATCKSFGYEIWQCDTCYKLFNINYTVGDHHYVVEDGSPATCLEPGRTQSVSCDVCGIVFEEMEWIQVLDHDYVSINDDNYHYCVNGQHYESHQYIVAERANNVGDLIYTYTCRECGHSYEVVDDNLITDEKGQKPIVFVTNGYVLNVGDEVTIYVQLLNNPGFNGAAFGIRYSDGLELIRFEEGTIIPNALEASAPVYNGYNFLWAHMNGANWTEDGYLLKLVFKVTSEVRKDQTIEIVYGDQITSADYGIVNKGNGGFATSSAKYGLQKFLTHSGTISFVDHLPGDVYGADGKPDGVVDIMDAMHIAWWYVGKEGITIKQQWADVNLDGKVDLYDVIWILQSISGNYGTNLLHYKYVLQLNLNGFDTDAFDKLVAICFYDEQGNVNSWLSQISFEEYEQEMNRQGYTFVGWYTRLVGGEKVDITDKITYDPNLGFQTLYAHWVKNSVSFDMNDATSEQLEDRIDSFDLLEPTQQYTVEYVIDGNTLPNYKPQTIYRRFLYWEDQLGNIYYANSLFDLDASNLLKKYIEAGCFAEGEEIKIVLKAIWGDFTLVLPISDGRAGYDKINDWYTDAYYQYPYNSENLSELVKNGFKLYAKSNYIQYTINYVVTSSGIYDDDCMRNVENLPKNTYSLQQGTLELASLANVFGYTFDGWYVNGVKISKIDSNNFESIFGENTFVSLMAKWNATAIAITIKGIDETYFVNSLYPSSRDLATIYYCYGDDVYNAGYYRLYNAGGFITRISNFSDIGVEYTDFDIKGCYTNVDVNNGHSYAEVSGKEYFTATGAVTSEKITQHDVPIIYAYCCPKQYTITFDMNHYGLLDRALGDSGSSPVWDSSCHNMVMNYKASNREYTLTIIGSGDDPHCTISQYVYLETGKTYYAHMTVSSDKINAIQMFYAIGGAYSEAQSMRFHGDKMNVFSVDKTGTYKIRLDNDAGDNVTITNFWITEAFTRSIDVYYNETIGTVTMPTSQYFIPRYEFDGVLYHNLTGMRYDNSGSLTIHTNWDEHKFSGEYIQNESQLMSVLNSNKDGIIIDDLYVIAEWTPIPTYSGTLDGKGHRLDGLSIFTLNTNGGLIGTLTGSVRNITFGDAYFEVSDSGQSEKMVYIGVVCGVNKGIIENVQVENSYISVWIGSTNYSTNQHAYVGMIAGVNQGKIVDCHVYTSSAIAQTTSQYGSANSLVGGIAGWAQSGSIIDKCSASNMSEINAGCYGEHTSKKSAWLEAYAGGIVGLIDSATVSNCSVVGNRLIANANNAASDCQKKYKGDIFGFSR